jgi:flagellar motor switch protein FliM
LRDLSVDVAVELGGARIKLGQLMDLQPGDVIPLTTRVGDPAIVPVMGRPKFTAHVGRIGNRFGVRVADVMAQ